MSGYQARLRARNGCGRTLSAERPFPAQAAVSLACQAKCVGPEVYAARREERMTGEQSQEVPQAPGQQQAAVATVTRRARVLLGWLTEDEARLFQNGRRLDPTVPEHEARARLARKVVSERPIWALDGNTVTEAPAEAQERLAALRAHPGVGPFVPASARVALVRLDRLCAAQPLVYIEHAEERARAAMASARRLLDVTLPIPQPQQLPVQQSGTPQQMTWVLSNPNPNLKVLANAQALQDGLGQLVGFVIGLQSSLLSVAEYAGRFVLTDGYHRAYGLLAEGVMKAPALIRPCTSVEELGLPPGMLRQEAWLGPRPALLGDYLDEDVSAEVALPATQRVIVVQATTIDLNTSGW